MSDNRAILAGFTVERMAHSEDGMIDLHCFILPDADLDGLVRAYDADECEFVTLKGWHWSFQDVNQPDGWRSV